MNNSGRNKRVANGKCAEFNCHNLPVGSRCVHHMAEAREHAKAKYSAMLRELEVLRTLAARAWHEGNDTHYKCYMGVRNDARRIENALRLKPW